MSEEVEYDKRSGNFGRPFGRYPTYKFRHGGSITDNRPEIDGRSSIIETIIGCERLDVQFEEELEASPLVALHPDDGWVDREKNIARFSYPAFFKKDEIAVGKYFALGGRDEYRIVQILQIEKSWLTSYHFVEVYAYNLRELQEKKNAKTFRNLFGLLRRKA